MAGTRKNQNVRGKEMKRRVLEEINADDALAVLNILAERDADASRKIEEIAVEYLSEVDIEDIALRVYHALDGIDVDEAYDRAGSSRYDYIHLSLKGRAWRKLRVPVDQEA
ncbi:MAG: hypothetical protein KKE79_05395 [Actinobacteria bacterium]|nr:hypothetical protein [Actinomycetota bacterium]MBU4490052.1 hypothetical protein [Actinomycetota bacterium]MCG2796597.1 hypothetical protein [Actinomycetes bacterium]